MLKKEEEIFVKRIDRFHQRIARQILGESVPFEAKYAWSKDPVPVSDRAKGNFKPITEGEVWGQAWESAWFHLKANVPQAWAGKSVVAHLDFTGEGLVVLPDGRLLQGITSGSIFDEEFSRDVVRLFDPAKGGEAVELWVETSSNSLFGVYLDPDPAPGDPGRFGHFESKVKHMRLRVFDKELWHLWLDLRVLIGLIKKLPEKGVRRLRLIRCANDAIDAFGDDSQNAAKSRAVLRREMGKPAAPSDLSALAIGHAHIDTAWLWPLRETVRKCARTFSSQVRLIETYPDYVFGASQAQQYEFVKEHYPGLYQKIKELVAKGRWEPLGGMWVEADCNIPNGESLVRQFLYGKNFFKDEFGVDVKNLWLPDVFGYSAALPQILKKSGIDYFLTQKMSWNQVNDFPYHTFRWRGIDGTEVLAHFPPENNYNSQLTPEYIVFGRDNFKERDFIDEFISLFGVGDGGGGPKEENLEFGLRMANLEGAPKIRFGRAADFFERLRTYEKDLPVWVGELYLEAHRGTLTTHALVKKMNRKIEQKLREVEFLWALLPLKDYPKETLDKVWKNLLLNQFHDIIPGSSIHEVYKSVHAEYREMLETCESLASQAAARLFEADEKALTLFNPLSVPFHGVVELPSNWQGAREEDGQNLPVQAEPDKTVALVSVPPHSFVTLEKTGKKAEGTGQIRPPFVLENSRVRYEFSPEGYLLHGWDKEAKREVVAAGEAGNRLTLYDDHPNNFDAWEIEVFYENTPLETPRDIKAGRWTDGPVRQGLHFEMKIGNSALEQWVFLAENSKRLDFQTRIDWKEKHRMLRVAFPVAIQATEAAFDIQYGYVRRSNHRNTSWERARFEAPGQRYADLSESDYGVALLNDCKYGYKVVDNVLDLNLLRSPNNPDPDADQHVHEFTYSLLPHTGDLVHSDVWAEAAQLNQGVAQFVGFRNKTAELPCQVEGEGVSLEVLKKAEKEDALVLRVVEILGRRTKARLLCRDKKATLVETNLLEWTEEQSFPTADPVEIELGPFEIKTFKVVV